MKLISIVVPCYNEEEVLPLCYKTLCEVVAKFPQETACEMVFVDDGSKDKTLEIIRGLAHDDDRVKYVAFSRNFGKEPAIAAGLKHAKGDYVALMDADLQDPPELLLEMYGRLSKDDSLDCMAARRSTREGEPFLRTFGAKSFYWLMSKISDVPLLSGVRDFRMMTRRMVDSILELDERNRFSKGIFGWVGYRTDWVEYENIERAAGESSWSLFGLMRYSIEGIVNFSTIPLSLASFFGFISCAIAVIWIIIIVVKTLLWGSDAAGYPSLACIILMLGGLQLLSIGVLGQYLARTYIETKARPLYFVKESK